jgi:heme O synthase-like polyprenyltransferase
MIALYTTMLVTASLLFAPLGLAGRGYEAIALVLGVAFLALAVRGLRGGTRFDARRWSKRVFAYSIPYLAVVLVALLADRVHG